MHVAQAVPVAELAHARDFQPRAVRSGDRCGVRSGASGNPELREHCVPGKHGDGPRRRHSPAEDKQSCQTGRARFDRLRREDTPAQRSRLIGLRGRGAGVTDREANHSRCQTWKGIIEGDEVPAATAQQDPQCHGNRIALKCLTGHRPLHRQPADTQTGR